MCLLSFISISILHVFHTYVFVCFGVLLCSLCVYGPRTRTFNKPDDDADANSLPQYSLLKSLTSADQSRKSTTSITTMKLSV